MRHLIILLSIITAFSIAGCGSGDEGHPHGEEGDHSHGETTEQPAQQTEQEQDQEGHAHGDGEGQHEEHSPQGEASQASVANEAQREGSGAVTQWTDETELFMEYPEIIVGQEATFAVHLTRLSDFKPLSNSEVHFSLRSENGAEISVTETDVQVPGIYGPDLTFEQSGRYDLTIEIYGMVNDTLQVRGIPVYNSAGDIPATSAGEDPNLITFLKEQQWNIPFGTAEAGRQTLSRTVEAHGEIMPAQNSMAVVTAPSPGIIQSRLNRSLPVEGRSVSEGATVAVLNPAVQSDGGDNFAQQFINAQSDLELAEEKSNRSQRLYEKEAIPEVELKQARVQLRQARARFQTISEVVQLDEGAEFYRFSLKAPISGTIIKSYVNPGMQVQSGQPLFEIANTSKIWLKARVPASEQPRIANAGSAAFSVQGSDQLYEVSQLGGQLISRGSSIDPQSRTVSLIYEMNNPENSLPLGQFSTVHIDTEQKNEVLAVPESALIEEEGNFVVFVHVSGESFEKRRVTLGIRDGDWVEIASGLDEGEHVVTENAYQVKLASLSSEAPAHGHAH
jgi:RND family efflux transporter MFP subunit